MATRAERSRDAGRAGHGVVGSGCTVVAKTPRSIASIGSVLEAWNLVLPRGWSSPSCSLHRSHQLTQGDDRGSVFARTPDQRR